MANIRKATAEDIAQAVRIYEHVLDNEEAGKSTVGWKRGIYPTAATVENAIKEDEFFVLEDEGEIVAAAVINQKQGAEYAHARWKTDAPPEKVMVFHTLAVDPAKGGHGYGTSFVNFYEEYAKQHGCPYLRMDTNAKNTPARRLYNRLGYEECDIVPCSFNGIDGVMLVCMEKVLK